MKVGPGKPHLERGAVSQAQEWNLTLVDLGEGVLRLFGVFYAIGAVVLLRQLRTWNFMDKALDQLQRTAAELSEAAGQAPAHAVPVDLQRNLWMAGGGALLFVAGVTMALGLRLAVIALGVLSLHQLLYFARQRRRERAAATAEEAEDARVAPATRHGFLWGLAMFVLAGWLERVGALG
jgi:hypothetical protein